MEYTDTGRKNMATSEKELTELQSRLREDFARLLQTKDKYFYVSNKKTVYEIKKTDVAYDTYVMRKFNVKIDGEHYVQAPFVEKNAKVKTMGVDENGKVTGTDEVRDVKHDYKDLELFSPYQIVLHLADENSQVFTSATRVMIQDPKTEKKEKEDIKFNLDEFEIGKVTYVDVIKNLKELTDGAKEIKFEFAGEKALTVPVSELFNANSVDFFKIQRGFASDDCQIVRK